jgi:hypothetical protein
MLDYFYPEEEQRFFTNREHILAVLSFSRDLLNQGVRKHLALNNFPHIHDALALLRAVLQAQSRVVYVVAGSMIGLMERIFLDAESPLFVHFQLETIGPFGRENCDALASKRLILLADPVPGDVLAAIYQVTRGHPFYIYATVMRVLENISLLN